MSRRARTRSSVFGLALVFLAIPLWWSTRGSARGHTSGDSDRSGFVVPPGFQVSLIRAGLDTKALAAAGVPSGSVNAVLQAAADTINANLSALPNADTALASARADSDRLQARIQSGLAAPEDLTAYQTATSNLATATTQRQTALNNIFSSATANLSPGQRAALTQIRANRAQDMSRDFPVEFLVVDRQQTEWVALRDALANEHIAIKLPDTLDDTAQANLATWRANGSVAAAKNSLDSTLAAVTTAWNTAAGVQ